MAETQKGGVVAGEDDTKRAVRNRRGAFDDGNCGKSAGPTC